VKVLLAYPPWQFYSPSKLYPLGVSYLASRLHEAGEKDVEILDLNLEVTEPSAAFSTSMALVESKKPDVLGMTCWTVHLPFCVEFTRRYKKRHPETTVVLGGVHASSQPEELFSLCPVDVIVRGEGEETFVHLIDALRNGRGPCEIPGLSWRNGGEILHNPDRPLLPDLDAVPFPAYGLLPPLERYQPLNRKPVASVVASRGCSYRCIFCSANRMWKGQRRRTPENVVREIRWLKENFGVGSIRFEDDDLTLRRDWALELFAKVKQEHVRFECLTRIDRVDGEIIAAMREAGCEGVYHGMESASPRLLALLHKGFPTWVDGEYVKRLVREEVRQGLLPTVSAMVGIPTETEEEIEATFALMGDLKRLGARTQLWILTPYPDTEIVKAYGDKMVRVDRWKEMKQFDVFSFVPRQAYAPFLRKHPEKNPDNWVFAESAREFRERKRLFLAGAGRLLGEMEFV